jgi:hypothetical protein
MNTTAHQSSPTRAKPPTRRTAAHVSILLATVIGAGGILGTVSPQGKPAGRSSGSLLGELEGAVEGLFVPSERDAPLVPFVLEGYDGGELRAADLLRLTGYDAAIPVEVVSLAEFFAAATAERDWHTDEERERAARFKRLAEILDGALEDVRVFKVGYAVKDVYILGRAGDGTYAGLRTRVVET